LELENQNIELKEELFAERDSKEKLRQQLEVRLSALKHAGHPTFELLQLLERRDLERLRLNTKIAALEKELKLKNSEIQVLHTRNSNLSNKKKVQFQSPIVQKKATTITDLRKPLTLSKVRPSDLNGVHTYKV